MQLLQKVDFLSTFDCLSIVDFLVNQLSKANFPYLVIAFNISVYNHLVVDSN